MKRAQNVRRLVIIGVLAVPLAVLGQEAPPASTSRIEALNAAFLNHVRGLPAAPPTAAATLAESLARDYSGENGESFVPDGLAVVYPAFRELLDAFDAERYADVESIARRLPLSADPFLEANATYYVARSLVERGLLEEAEQYLGSRVTAEARLGERTPYAGHAWFLKGYCLASNLRFEAAVAPLRVVVDRFSDGPEAVVTGARQLLLELERREIGTLAEVASMLDYAGARLRVADAGERVREQQRKAIEQLDKLIKENEDKEKSGMGRGGARGRSARGRAPRRAANPAEESRIMEGPGKIGDLHDPGKADPSEMWGKLPPAEREKILQSLRARFPSRYRELVEQYYRNLAQEK